MIKWKHRKEWHRNFSKFLNVICKDVRGFVLELYEGDRRGMSGFGNKRINNEFKKCSVCSEWVPHEAKYCPFCGREISISSLSNVSKHISFFFGPIFFLTSSEILSSTLTTLFVKHLELIRLKIKQLFYCPVLIIYFTSKFSTNKIFFP